MHRKKAPGERLGNPQLAGGLNYSDVRDGASGPGGLGGSAGISKAASRREGIAIPNADPNWRPKARSWYNSLKLSGQSELFEASDWATAVAAADAYDTFLKTWNASVFSQFSRLSERLGATVIDRKKSRIELDGPEPDDADEEAADDAILGWHGRLAGRSLSSGAPLHVVPAMPDHGDEDGAP